MVWTLGSCRGGDADADGRVRWATRRVSSRCLKRCSLSPEFAGSERHRIKQKYRPGDRPRPLKLSAFGADIVIGVPATSVNFRDGRPSFSRPGDKLLAFRFIGR